jgi:hypothetical protein
MESNRSASLPLDGYEAMPMLAETDTRVPSGIINGLPLRVERILFETFTAFK